MFSLIWHTFFLDPVYNTLVFFIDVIPGGDVGLAIICTTILVKFILLPLSIKAVKTQVAMQEIEHTIAVVISNLRKALDDDARSPRFIETVSKRGYRLLVVPQFDADASGAVGPNLDNARPDATLVRERVNQGKGGMPSFQGRLSDDEVDAVVDYVSTAAGSTDG